MTSPDSGGSAEIELVPIPLAAQLVYDRVHGGASTTLSEESLARVATLISVFTTLYLRTNGRALSPEEVAGGAFTGSGWHIVFADGRASLEDLAVTRDSVEDLAERFLRLGVLKRMMGRL